MKKVRGEAKQLDEVKCFEFLHCFDSVVQQERQHACKKPAIYSFGSSLIAGGHGLPPVTANASLREQADEEKRAICDHLEHSRH